MTRPVSRPEFEAARIWADAFKTVTGCDLPDETRPWSEADETWVDRCVAATDPDTGKPTRLNRRTR